MYMVSNGASYGHDSSAKQELRTFQRVKIGRGLIYFLASNNLCRSFVFPREDRRVCSISDITFQDIQKKEALIPIICTTHESAELPRDYMSLIVSITDEKAVRMN